MTKKLLATLFVVISLFTLCVSANASSSASEFTLGYAVSPNTGQHQISVDDSSTGTTISLSINDTLTINLKSNSSSTGFSWQLDQINASVLNYVSHQHIPAPRPMQPGTEEWVFQPVGVGTSAIFMEYSQPWPGGTKGAKTYNLTVNVTPPVPASSNLAIGILTAGLAALIVWLSTKKRRQSQI